MKTSPYKRYLYIMNKCNERVYYFFSIETSAP